MSVCCILLSPALYKIASSRDYYEKKFWSGTFILLSLSIGFVVILPWLGALNGGNNAIAFVLFYMSVSYTRVTKYALIDMNAQISFLIIRLNFTAGPCGVLATCFHSNRCTSLCSVINWIMDTISKGRTVSHWPHPYTLTTPSTYAYPIIPDHLHYGCVSGSTSVLWLCSFLDWLLMLTSYAFRRPWSLFYL